MIAQLGATMTVIIEGRTWIVPRHYIALHGIKGSEMPAVAAKYGFEEVKK